MSSGTETERRAHPRLGLALPATVTRIGGRPLESPGSTVDVSQGGARLAGTTGFSVGDVVVLTITGADDLSVSNQGLVVGASPGGDLHVAFKSLDDAAAVDLRRLLGD